VGVLLGSMPRPSILRDSRVCGIQFSSRTTPAVELSIDCLVVKSYRAAIDALDALAPSVDTLVSNGSSLLVLSVTLSSLKQTSSSSLVASLSTSLAIDCSVRSRSF
jgi:hypothetical protein